MPFFSRVTHSRIVVGLRIGLVAGAASTGALIGLGLRHGSALTPFQLYGRVVTASLTGLVPTDATAVAVGLAVHLFWMALWGAGFALVARSRHLPRLVAVATGFCAAAGWLGSQFFPSLLGAAAVASLGTGQLLLFLLLVAAALVAGMRLADV